MHHVHNGLIQFIDHYDGVVQETVLSDSINRSTPDT